MTDDPPTSLQNNDLIRQNEKLKVELREAQRQLEKAKTAANSERSSPDGEGGKGSPDPEGDGAELSEGQLIMRLKNQGRVHSTCLPSSEDNWRRSNLVR